MDRFTLGDSASEESLNFILGKFLPEAVMNPTQENKYQDDESRDDEEHRVRIMDTVEAVEVDDVRCECTPIDKCATPIDQKSTKRRVTFVEEDVIIQIYNEANSLADDDDDDSTKTLVDDRNVFDLILCVSCS